MSSPTSLPPAQVIVWAEQDVKAHRKFLQEAKSDLARSESTKLSTELRAIMQSPFAVRVDALEGGEPATFYLTKARFGIQHADPILVSWTAPIASLRVAKFGEQRLLGPRQTEFVLTMRASYEAGAHAIRDVRYESERGSYSVTDLRELVRLATARGTEGAALKVEQPSTGDEVRSPVPDSREELGLREIIFETDFTQDQTLRFPMRGHLLIEGAPGSGKTTVALQRIPYLIDQQFDELDRPLDRPYFSEQSTLVVVVSDVLKHYIRNLISELRIPDVELQSLRDLLRLEVRRRALAAGYKDNAPESNAAVLLKARGGILQRLRESARVTLRTALTSVGWVVDMKFNRLACLENAGGQQMRDSVSRAFTNAARAGERSGAVWAALDEMWDELRDASRRLSDPDRAEFEEFMQSLDELVTYACLPARVLREFVRSDAADQWARECAESGVKELAEGGAARALEEWRASISRDRLGPRDGALLAHLSHWMTEGQQDRQRVRGLWLPWRRYAHVVIDEAQDFTEVELAFLLTLSEPQYRCVTLVGDLAQRLNWPAGLVEWEAPGLKLRDEDGHIGLFKINYRQTKALGEFAYRFHERAFGKPPQFAPNPRSAGVAPKLVIEPLQTQLMMRIADAVLDLAAVDAARSIAVLAESREDAELIYEAVEPRLSEVAECALATDTPLTRRGVVHVMGVEQAKGLEFDYVVLVEGLQDESGALRKSVNRENGLYVGITRACGELCVCATGAGFPWDALIEA